MGKDGIFLTAETFRELAPATQADILERLTGGVSAPVGRAVSQPAGEDDAEIDEQFVQLSPTQAREFLSGCGDRTRKVLQVIAEGPSRHFKLAVIAKELGANPSDMRGVWSGLTRRLYTIINSRDVHLISWAPEGIFDDNGVYVDHVAEVTEMTYQSLRKVLKVK